MKTKYKSFATKYTILLASLLIVVLVFVGCTSSFDPNRPISIISRENSSGTRTAFMELLYADMGNPHDIELPYEVSVQNSTAAIINTVASNSQSIGYDSLGYVVGNKDIKILNLQDQSPTQDGYKLSRPFSVVYRDTNFDNSDATKKFVEFLNSTEAKQVIEGGGYSQIIKEPSEYKRQDNLIGSNIKITGSSSVHPLMERLIEEFYKLQPNVSIDLIMSSSGAGRTDITNDNADFAMQSSTVTQQMITQMESGNGEYKVLNIEFAMDAIAIIVHRTNTLDNITMDMLRDLYNRQATNFSSWNEMLSKDYAAN